MNKRTINIYYFILTSLIFSCKNEEPDILDISNLPNIILILVDDLGYDDIEIYNQEGAEMHHLNNLSKRGVKFTNGYVTSSFCTPSRAGILAGRYPQKFGVNHVVHSSYSTPIEKQGIPEELNLLPEFLKEYGYITGLIGKWHLGEVDNFHPLNHGFDYFYGTRFGITRYIDPNDANAITTNHISVNSGKRKPGTLNRNFENIDNKKYLTDEFTEESISFIKKNLDQPFFLCLSYTSPHWPYQTTKDYFNSTENIDPSLRVYYSMIKSIDNGIGKIDSTLIHYGISDETLIFFLSDNGCEGRFDMCNHSKMLSGNKNTLYEGGIRVPFIMVDIPEYADPSNPVVELVSKYALHFYFACHSGRY